MVLPALENVTRPIRAGPVIPSSFLSIYIIRARFIFSVPTGIEPNRRLAQTGSDRSKSLHESELYASGRAKVEVTVWPRTGSERISLFGASGLCISLTCPPVNGHSESLYCPERTAAPKRYVRRQSIPMAVSFSTYA